MYEGDPWMSLLQISFNGRIQSFRVCRRPFSPRVSQKVNFLEKSSFELF